MFERYTEKARRVVFFGRYEASEFGSSYIETEHLLLGLLREDKALANRFGLGSSESIRKEIESKTTVGKKVPTSVDLPVSNECKRVLSHAKEEADGLGHKHIGTEHLLLGILREEKCFAAKLLYDRGLRLNQVREQLREHVRSFQAEREVRPQPAAGASGLISEFVTNVILQAANGVLPPLVGRENELQRVIQVLHRRTRGNPVLVGEPGVGKRTIIYGLAQRITQGLDRYLNDKIILSLDLTVIASGIKSRASFEDNLESIRRELSSSGNLILFIEGMHALAQAQRFLNIANVIKPRLLDGSVQCISTATPGEYSKTVEEAPWLEELFTVVDVKPPTEPEAIQVLLSMKDRFQKFHGVTYTDEAIQYAVFHAGSYFPNRHLPEKAIDLMDEAGARVKLRNNKLPDEVVEVQKRIKFMVHRMENAISNHEFEKARFYSDEERKERENLRELGKKHKLGESATPEVTREDIEQIVVERTGLSIELLRKSQAKQAGG